MYLLVLDTGTYGTVFKAKNRESHEIVALKRVRLDDDDEVSIKVMLYVCHKLLDNLGEALKKDDVRPHEQCCNSF